MLSDMTTTPPDLPESWEVEDSEVKRPRSKVLPIVGIVVVALLAVGAVSLLFRKDEGKKAWAASTGGPPAGVGADTTQVTADVKPGYYLWSDFNGWHLWVVNGDGVKGAKGTIENDDTFASAVLATKGAGTVSKDGKSVSFDLPTDPRVVGIDFNPGFYSHDLKVKLTDADGPVDPKLVTIGRSATVDQMPFELKQVPADEAPKS